MEVLKKLIKQFVPFAKEQMGFSRPPKLFLRQDSTNAANPLGKTGFYDPDKESITLYTTGRHPKDIMRSLSHELMHHTQKCNGDFDNVGEMGEGYAQADGHLRTMEIQAYQASIVFRDWEDSTRGTIYFEHLQNVKGDNGSMSIKDWKNKEIKTLLTEKWGFSFNLDALNENVENEDAVEEGCPAGKPGDKEQDDPEFVVSLSEEEEELEELVGRHPGDDRPRPHEREPVPEEEEEDLDESGPSDLVSEIKAYALKRAVSRAVNKALKK